MIRRELRQSQAAAPRRRPCSRWAPVVSRCRKLARAAAAEMAIRKMAMGFERVECFRLEESSAESAVELLWLLELLLLAVLVVVLVVVMAVKV